MQEFDGPALSNCLWAFAQLRHYPGASLLTAAALNICCSLDDFTPQVCLTGLFMCLLCASLNLAGCNPGGRLTALGKCCAAQRLRFYHQLLQADAAFQKLCTALVPCNLQLSNANTCR